MSNLPAWRLNFCKCLQSYSSVPKHKWIDHMWSRICKLVWIFCLWHHSFLDFLIVFGIFFNANQLFPPSFLSALLRRQYLLGKFSKHYDEDEGENAERSCRPAVSKKSNADISKTLSYVFLIPAALDSCFFCISYLTYNMPWKESLFLTKQRLLSWFFLFTYFFVVYFYVFAWINIQYYMYISLYLYILL